MSTAPPSRRRPEVLAPAGDEAALDAAIRAGADAVYFGLQGFNARARAKNFDTDGLARTLARLHERGARGYVTLNTLVFDDELPSVEAAARACAAAGVDAVIVQDLGVARLVRAVAPDLPIHASTQMTCTDAGAVELARELGVERVILARELSLDDIARIRAQTDMDLEVFVHGALCIAYSGQCLTSEALGGRSANRGACAQACRLPYQMVVDGVLRDLGDRAYLLSPEDLEASALIPQLVDLGIASVKIEGRLKGPEYVAATTRLYRAAIEAAMSDPSSDDATRRGAPVQYPDAALRDVALQMYSRGSGPGFLAGIDHQRLVEGRACDHRGLLTGDCLGAARHRGRLHLRVRLARAVARGEGVLLEGGFGGEGEIGGRIWGVLRSGEDVERADAGDEVLLWLGPDVSLAGAREGRRVWKTSDPAREKAVLAEVDRAPHRLRVDVRVTGQLGELPRFEASTDTGLRATITGDAPLTEAHGGAPFADVLRDKLGRLGDTPFALGQVDLDLPSAAMLPPSSLNRARRALVEHLLAAARRAWTTTTRGVADLLDAARPADRAPPPAGLFVLCRSLAQAEAALDAGADGVYLDLLELTGTGPAVRALRTRGASFVGVAPPRIRKPGEEKIDRYLATLQPDAILVRGLGTLHDGTGAGIARIGDFSLNVTNRLSAAEVLSRDLAAFTPSFDLDATQLAALLDGPFAPFAEVVVHHPMPLFHMEHCVIAALLSEGKDHRDCGRPCERHQIALRDRTGMDHPVEADVGCRNTVFHAAAQSAAGVVQVAQQSGARRFRIELVREGREEVGRIVSTYRKLLKGTIGAAELRRTLRTEGGYGVVAGSLRVLQA
ncbi:U32 family peptidase [Chondromyces crocatus]|uniref:Peptidase U32 n=1 Tax=Chondromyces crocatus TaxID=52 RepID=A0A0K1EPU1_CHOCO|nr:U32 family peptidase [Chondromyces crocatus]AKT42871.1 peptidase U32 [Chondromyces crocatus]